MKVIMRVYRQHDLDLLYLYKFPGFSLQQAIKNSLRAYIHNEDFKIVFPDTNNVEVSIPKNAQFHVYLSDKSDADIIAWLKLISNGYRNSLLKNIVRHYMAVPQVTPYLATARIEDQSGSARGGKDGDVIVFRGDKEITEDEIDLILHPEKVQRHYVSPPITEKEIDTILRGAKEQKNK